MDKLPLIKLDNGLITVVIFDKKVGAFYNPFVPEVLADTPDAVYVDVDNTRYIVKYYDRVERVAFAMREELYA